MSGCLELKFRRANNNHTNDLWVTSSVYAAQHVGRNLINRALEFLSMICIQTKLKIKQFFRSLLHTFDDNNETLLHQWCKHSSYRDMLKIFVEYDNGFFYPDHSINIARFWTRHDEKPSKTPLMIAIECNNIDAVKYLCDKFWNVIDILQFESYVNEHGEYRPASAKDDGITALEFAFWIGADVEIINILLFTLMNKIYNCYKWNLKEIDTKPINSFVIHFEKEVNNTNDKSNNDKNEFRKTILFKILDVIQQVANIRKMKEKQANKGYTHSLLLNEINQCVIDDHDINKNCHDHNCNNSTIGHQLAENVVFANQLNEKFYHGICRLLMKQRRIGRFGEWIKAISYSYQFNFDGMLPIHVACQCDNARFVKFLLHRRNEDFLSVDVSEKTIDPIPKPNPHDKFNVNHSKLETQTAKIIAKDHNSVECLRELDIYENGPMEKRSIYNLIAKSINFGKIEQWFRCSCDIDNLINPPLVLTADEPKFYNCCLAHNITKINMDECHNYKHDRIYCMVCNSDNIDGNCKKFYRCRENSSNITCYECCFAMLLIHFIAYDTFSWFETTFEIRSQHSLHGYDNLWEQLKKPTVNSFKITSMVCTILQFVDFIFDLAW